MIYSCLICDKIFDLKSQPLHVQTEYMVSGMCAECQDSVLCPLYCEQCEKVISRSKNSCDCGGPLIGLNRCIECNEVLGFTADGKIQFYGPEKCEEAANEYGTHVY
jgi:hypothetical protein